MKRRDFLKKMPVAVLPSIIGGMSMKAYGNSPMLDAMTAGLLETDRVLVIIQMSGGNDGLNTIIPLDQYSAYNTVRDNIAIPENKVLKLKGTNDKTGIHPAMQRLWQMNEDDRMAVIQSVGYPNFNFSHFRATDIWMSGSDSNKVVNSGWAGRYLNYEYANYPVGFPNTTMPDPIAIRISGSGVGLGLQNIGSNMGVSITNTNDLLDMSDYVFTDDAPMGFPGKELSYIREVQRQTDKFGDVIKVAGDKGKNVSDLYAKNGVNYTDLSNSLRIVARLIAGGLKTRIYWVNVGGFDTHFNQVNAGDKATGTHASLLQNVSESIYGFVDDLKKQNLSERVIGFTFSEFGRRVKSNGSGGTDHGAAAPMIIFGDRVKGGVLGNNPTIDPAATANSNVPMQYDFRSVYASVLKDWFCVPTADLDNIMLKNFQTLNLLDTSVCVPVSTHDENARAGDNMLMPYPNPFTESTNVKYETLGGHTMVQVFNNEGVILQTLVDEHQSEGQYDVRCDLGQMPAGIYYVRLQNGSMQQVKPMLKIK